MMKDTVQLKKDDVNALVRQVEKYQRRKAKYLSEDQKNEISKIHIQHTLAKKGAEEAYTITRLELFEQYLKEEIEVYESNESTGSPKNDESSSDRGDKEVVVGEARTSKEHR